MKCPNCGCELPTNPVKRGASVLKDALLHPKKAFEKKEYPRDCKRKCCKNVRKEPEV